MKRQEIETNLRQTYEKEGHKPQETATVPRIDQVGGQPLESRQGTSVVPVRPGEGSCGLCKAGSWALPPRTDEVDH